MVPPPPFQNLNSSMHESPKCCGLFLWEDARAVFVPRCIEIRNVRLLSFGGALSETLGDVMRRLR